MYHPPFSEKWMLKAVFGAPLRRLLSFSLFGLLMGSMLHETARGQAVTTEFARITMGGGAGSSTDYQVESAVNALPAGPGFQQQGMYDQVPVLWLESSPSKLYIELLTPADGAVLTEGTFIRVEWSADRLNPIAWVQLELWRQDTRLLILGQDYDFYGRRAFRWFVPKLPTIGNYVLVLRSLQDPSLWDEVTVSLTDASNAVRPSQWMLYQ